MGSSSILFNLANTGGKETLPLVTIPAGENEWWNATLRSTPKLLGPRTQVWATELLTLGHVVCRQ